MEQNPRAGGPPQIHGLIGQVEGRGQILVVRPLPLGEEGVEIDFDQVKIDIDAGKNKSLDK